MRRWKNTNNGYNLPFGIDRHNFDFDRLYQYYYNWLLSIAFELLQIDNLPDTVDPTFFKLCLYVNGKVTFFRADNGDLLALNGSATAEPNVYYVPQNVIINNPQLQRTYDLTLNKNCVTVYCTETDKYNFDFCGGLYGLIHKTATMLADNDISINVAQRNTRLINIISADDQNTKNSIDIVFKRMYQGEPYAVVQSNLISDLKAIPLTPSANNSYIVQLVELHQYILSHFYEAVGLQTHDQIKKERLITAEVNDNPALAKLNIANIYETVRSGIEKVNAMFDTDITVKINPIIMHNNDNNMPQSDADADNVDDNFAAGSAVPSSSNNNNNNNNNEVADETLNEKKEEITEGVESEKEVAENQSEKGQEIKIDVTVNDDATANITVVEKDGEEKNVASDIQSDTPLLDRNN